MSPSADNELSPECLDGAQSFLAKDGISIPCKYVSYLAPLTSSKLHNEVKAYSDLVHFETPCVAICSAEQFLDAQIDWVIDWVLSCARKNTTLASSMTYLSLFTVLVIAKMRE